MDAEFGTLPAVQPLLVLGGDVVEDDEDRSIRIVLILDDRRECALPADVAATEGQSPASEPPGARHRRMRAALEHLFRVHVGPVGGIDRHGGKPNPSARNWGTRRTVRRTIRCARRSGGARCLRVPGHWNSVVPGPGWRSRPSRQAWRTNDPNRDHRRRTCRIRGGAGGSTARRRGLLDRFGRHRWRVRPVRLCSVEDLHRLDRYPHRHAAGNRPGYLPRSLERDDLAARDQLPGQEPRAGAVLRHPRAPAERRRAAALR